MKTDTAPEFPFTPETERDELWRILFLVAPTPAHPQFFKVDVGWLAVWLFAPDLGTAAQRAMIHLAVLPYESKSDTVFSAGWSEIQKTEATPELLEEFNHAVRAAFGTGLGLFYNVQKTGEDLGPAFLEKPPGVDATSKG